MSWISEDTISSHTGKCYRARYMSLVLTFAIERDIGEGLLTCSSENVTLDHLVGFLDAVGSKWRMDLCKECRS